MSNDTLDVVHPYDGSVVASVPVAEVADVEDAIGSAVDAAPELRSLPARVRADALLHISRRLSERSEELAETICAEAGKPIQWARVEATRAISTFRWAAEEARRFSGEVQRLDTEAGSEGRFALTRRFSRGPIVGITPFNFPLNLVAHKVAPALAVGAPIVVKPAPRTPLSALLLAEIIAETELPQGACAVLVVENERAAELVSDPRLPTVSFTGSASVGWGIREAVPAKHVTLELGGDAAVIVAEDWPESERDAAARRIAYCGHGAAGQSCIAVQRVFIAESLYDEMAERIVRETEALVTGDPRDEAVEVGPMIDDAAAQRASEWITEAVDAGAGLLAGGTREGTNVAPTVLDCIPHGCTLAREEAFAPVISLTPFDSFDEACSLVNASKYGLQAGVFTRDVGTTFAAHSALDVGGVIVGDVPTYRADHMPYGGVKDSGVGREGIRCAMDDYTEPRVLVFTGVSL